MAAWISGAIILSETNGPPGTICIRKKVSVMMAKTASVHHQTQTLQARSLVKSTNLLRRMRKRRHGRGDQLLGRLNALGRVPALLVEQIDAAEHLAPGDDRAC